MAALSLSHTLNLQTGVNKTAELRVGNVNDTVSLDSVVRQRRGLSSEYKGEFNGGAKILFTVGCESVVEERNLKKRPAFGNLMTLSLFRSSVWP
jgi:hypothetical protein